MTNNEIKSLENIEFHLGFAGNEVQFEEKLKIVLRPALEKLASSHEIVRKKAMNILNHINKRMSKTVKLPWDSLVELVLSVNFMNSVFVKNFTIMYLKKASDSLAEKDKITHLLPLIKNIELKPCNQKKFLFEIILEFLQKLNLKFADLETKEVVDGLYSLYECSRLLSCQQELLFQSQSLKAKIMDYLCKSMLAANTFPAMLHVSFDCLYSPKTDENLQKQGVKFIQWITRMVDTTRLKLIGKVLLFGLLKNIKEAGTENLDNLTREQEIKTLLFKPFYGPLDSSIHSPEEDNENLRVVIIKFQEFNQLNQLDNEENIQEMEKILEENTDKSSHMLHCCILKYAFSIFQFASILKKTKFSYSPKILNLIHEKYTQCTHHLVDTLQISQLTLKNTSFTNYKESANIENPDGMSQICHCHCHGIGVEKDERKACISYQKSAEMRHVDAYSVGYRYEKGIGVEKNEYKAFIYYQKSANMGNARGINNVGVCYYYGRGVEKDEHKAFIYYQKSAEMGQAEGIFNSGVCYEKGNGVEKDERKAFTYFQKSAEMGYVNGIYKVGNCYRDGVGVEKDEHKAFIHFQKVAEMGHVEGIINAGHYYLFGVEVEKDEHKAFTYFQKATEMGDVRGMSKVAECYRNGIGITRDLQKAKYWYQREKDLTAETNEWMHNAEVDEDLKKILTENKYQLPWISYDEFKEIFVLGEGGFATVYHARWLDNNKGFNMRVALKLFHRSNNNREGFIRELKAYCDIGRKNPTFLRCLGISKDKVSKDYILVIKHTLRGSLRESLQSVAQMDWKDKLNLLHCIASDLQIIHSHDLIHRDLHSGNILLENFKSAYIGDLGLSIEANIALRLKSDRVYGILPYIPPEVLENKPYTKASDIYSFSIIMWEILFGRIYESFHEYSEPQLKIEIVVKKLRPPIPPIPESCYIYFMKRCWNNDPEKRPSVLEICETFVKWQNDENILFELTEYDKKNKQNILFELIEDDKKIMQTKNYIANDNFFDEISPDTSFNYNMNLKGESRDLDLIINFEESRSVNQ